jgi:adenine-specific DNA-methyltransferase
LLPEFSGKIDLIYIDPPFTTGQDFSYVANIPDYEGTSQDEPAAFVKEPSILEQKAYRDTWGKGLDSYLQMMFERLTIMYELLSDKGTIYVHVD